MRTFTSSLGNFTAEAFDYQAWVQERNIVKIHLRVGNQVYVNYTLYGQETKYWSAKYTADANGDIYIDVTDIMRVNYHYKKSMTGSIYITWMNVGSGDVMTIDWRLVGLINPSSVSDFTPDREFDGVLIMPPSRMIYAPYSLIQIETYTLFSGLSLVQIKADGTIASQTPIGSYSPSSILLPLTTRSIYYNIVAPGVNTKTKTINLESMRPCGRICVVRWVSFTGQVRCHVLERIEASTKTTDSVDLMTIDGSFNRLKGRTDSFYLYLDGLNAYDYWYYSDVIHSSKVEVSFDGSSWRQVDVMQDSVTIPDGDAGEFNKLKIQVKYREYDATDM